MRFGVLTTRDRGVWRLGLLGLVTFGLFAVQPWLWSNVFDGASAFRDRQTHQQQLVNVQRLTEDVRTIDPADAALLEQAGVAFPNSAAAPQIVERLEGLAENQGLLHQLRSIRELKPQGQGSALIPFDIEIVVTGPPQSLLAFFDALEHMQEMTQVQEWRMRPLEVVPGSPKTYQLEVKVRFFLQPTP